MPAHLTLLIHSCDRNRIRRGSGSVVWLAVIGMLGVMALFGGLYFFYAPTGDDDPEGVETYEVRRGPFVYHVSESGEIESSKNVEVRCKVKTYGKAGTSILKVVAEGTVVEEGDFLVQLDSSALEDELTARQITVNNSRASMVKAKNTYETAKISKTEYLEGTFKAEVQKIQNEIFVAEENLRRAEDYLGYSKRLAAKGYVTPVQLLADRFAVEKSRGDLKAAKTRLMVLQKYTRAKQITTLESDIVSAEAHWKSEKNSHELDVRKLAEIEEQIKACTIVAPSAGQVVHANSRDRRGGQDVVIEEGIQVRENQVLIRLPDPAQMQVKAKINESRINFVRPGMKATISVPAFPNLALEGEVIRVNEYPEPGHWLSSNVKTYATTVRIFGSHEDLRPGLSAEATILVEQLEDQLQIEVHSVIEHGGKHFCFRKNGSEWESDAVEVTLGMSNEEKVIITSGLSEGDLVASSPRRHRHEVTLPKIDTEKNTQKIGTPPKETDSEQISPAGPDREKKRKARAKPSKDRFRQMDTNSDGKITESEAGSDAWNYLKRADTNGDGGVDQAEMKAAMNRTKQNKPTE